MHLNGAGFLSLGITISLHYCFFIVFWTLSDWLYLFLKDGFNGVFLKLSWKVEELFLCRVYLWCFSTWRGSMDGLYKEDSRAWEQANKLAVLIKPTDESLLIIFQSPSISLCGRSHHLIKLQGWQAPDGLFLTTMVCPYSNFCFRLITEIQDNELRVVFCLYVQSILPWKITPPFAHVFMYSVELQAQRKKEQKWILLSFPLIFLLINNSHA